MHNVTTFGCYQDGSGTYADYSYPNDVFDYDIEELGWSHEITSMTKSQISTVLLRELTDGKPFSEGKPADLVSGYENGEHYVELTSRDEIKSLEMMFEEETANLTEEVQQHNLWGQDEEPIFRDEMRSLEMMSEEDSTNLTEDVNEKTLKSPSDEL